MLRRQSLSEKRTAFVPEGRLPIAQGRTCKRPFGRGCGQVGNPHGHPDQAPGECGVVARLDRVQRGGPDQKDGPEDEDGDPRTAGVFFMSRLWKPVSCRSEKSLSRVGK